VEGVSSLLYNTCFLYRPLMARPLRLEFRGAVYHVTARGDGRERIFLDDEDRQS
jgi:hypothetical protein